MDPHPRGAHGTLDLARMLVLDLQTHVLQHRERVGEHHRAAPDLEELEAQPPLSRLEGAVEAHLDAVLLDALHLLHVEHRDPRGVVLSVVGTERVAVAPEQARAALLAEGLEQGVVQVVGPGAAHHVQAALQVRDVVARSALRIDVDDEVEPGQHRLREQHRELGVRPAERLLEDALDDQPAPGGESIPGHEHDARVEPPEPVRVHEQPDPLPLLQVQDPHRRLEQIVGGDLEEQIPGEGVDGVLQRLGGVAVAGVVRAAEHGGRLAPQQGDVARHAVVRGGGVEAEEPADRAHLAFGVELPDADVVEMARTVHRGADVRAGEHEKLGFLRIAPPARRRQVRERFARPPALVAQQPEPRARLRHEPLPAPGLLDSILGEAQEREVVVLDPLEEGAGLLELLGVDERRRRPQIRGAAAKLLAHGAPVLDRGPDVVERAAHLLGHRVEHLLLGLAIGLDVDDRLDDRSLVLLLDGEEPLDAAVLGPAEAHHGMDGEVVRVPASVEHHPHRVDQERHVVGDDLDDGMGRLPAVLLDLGVVDPDPGSARGTSPGEVEVRRRGAVEIVRLAFREVVGRDARVVPGDEGQDEIEVLGTHPLARERGDLVHQLESAACSAEPSLQAAPRVAGTPPPSGGADVQYSHTPAVPPAPATVGRVEGAGAGGGRLEAPCDGLGIRPGLGCAIDRRARRHFRAAAEWADDERAQHRGAPDIPAPIPASRDGSEAPSTRTAPGACAKRRSSPGACSTRCRISPTRCTCSPPSHARAAAPTSPSICTGACSAGIRRSPSRTTASATCFRSARSGRRRLPATKPPSPTIPATPPPVSISGGRCCT